MTPIIIEAGCEIAAIIEGNRYGNSSGDGYGNGSESSSGKGFTKGDGLNPAQPVILSDRVNPEPVRIKFVSPVGTVKGEAVPSDANWRFTLTLENGTAIATTKQINPDNAEKELRSQFKKWVKSLRFKVSHITASGYVETRNCQCVEINPHYNPARSSFIFKLPNGKKVQVFGMNDFEVMS
jgi:hypothetical protein